MAARKNETTRTVPNTSGCDYHPAVDCPTCGHCGFDFRSSRNKPDTLGYRKKNGGGFYLCGGGCGTVLSYDATKFTLPV